jgi:hypothetical protein
VATDTRQIVANLVAFYDLADKTVVAVGAGGGQLVEYARGTRRVVAVDKDGAAIDRLAARARACGLAERFVLVPRDFFEVRASGDVVLFEFCLHQMADPARAIRRAQELAEDVLVLDHAPVSRWSWCAAEEDRMETAWKAVESRSVRRRLDVEAAQRFCDYAELEARLAGQGPVSLERIGAYRGHAPICIPMPYRLALL